MDSMTAQDFMVTRLVTLAPEMDVHDAVKLLLKSRISGAPVVDEKGRYLGVFSEKCSMQVILDAAYEGLPSNEVGAFMDVDARTITPDTQLLTIAQVFLLTSYRRLPVVSDQGWLLGQVSRRDVMKAAVQALDRQPFADQPGGRERSFLYLSAVVSREDAPLE